MRSLYRRSRGAARGRCRWPARPAGTARPPAAHPPPPPPAPAATAAPCPDACGVLSSSSSSSCFFPGGAGRAAGRWAGRGRTGGLRSCGPLQINDRNVSNMFICLIFCSFIYLFSFEVKLASAAHVAVELESVIMSNVIMPHAVMSYENACTFACALGQHFEFVCAVQGHGWANDA